MENDYVNRIKEEVGAYGESLCNVGRLRVVGIVSRILGLFLLIFTVVLLVFALLSFGAVAAIDALSNCMPVWAASLIVGSVFLILLVIAVAFRKPLFIHPFILLMTKQIRSEEELALKTMEAEHQAEIQGIRLESRVENATRELNLYANIFGRIWSWLSGKLTK
ncbi:MAG: phage holin family protein [Paludibacteraceae bacterium]|nr:phage holin family protein [Paludibacteraceae bacterium]